MIDHGDRTLRTVDPDDLSKQLSLIEQAGGDILVCGEVRRQTLASVARAQASQLGQPSVRVMAHTDAVDRDTLVPDGIPTRHVPIPRTVRATAAQAGPTDEETPDGVDTPEALTNDLVTAITDLREDEPLDRRDVHIGVFTLAPLLHSGGIDQTIDLIRSLETLVESWSATADYYLPLAPSDPTVQDLSEHVNARLDVRTRDGIEVRWFFAELDDSTDWVPL